MEWPTRQANTVLCESSDPYSILVLDNPERPFHGDHWFHLGEYYLSQRRSIAKMVDRAPSADHLLIAATNWKFFSMVSQFTFFMLLLCLPADRYRSVRLIFSNHGVADQLSATNASLSGSPAPFYWAAPHTGADLITLSSNSSQDSVCFVGTLVGKVGDHPVRTRDWFDTASDVLLLRRRLASLCPLPTSSSPAGNRKYHAVLYQRDHNRRIMNAENVMRHLQDLHGASWSFTLVHHNELREPCALHSVLSTADVFVTTHGFQMMSMLLLQPGTHVFEHFPHKYFKPSYFPLSQALSLHHSWQYGTLQSLYSGPDSPKPWSTASARWVLPFISLKHCMQHIKCRSLSRQQDVLFQDSDVDSIVEAMQQAEGAAKRSLTVQQG